MPVGPGFAVSFQTTCQRRNNHPRTVFAAPSPLALAGAPDGDHQGDAEPALRPGALRLRRRARAVAQFKGGGLRLVAGPPRREVRRSGAEKAGARPSEGPPTIEHRSSNSHLSRHRRRSEPLGFCSISLADVWTDIGGENDGGNRESEWRKLEPLTVGSKRKGSQHTQGPCGEVELRISLRRGTGDVQEDAVAEAEAARWFVADGAVGDRYADKPPNALKVAVVRAINLIVADSDFFGGKSDPFVVMTAPCGWEARSRVVRKNLNPVWMQTFECPLGAYDDGELPPIDVLVYDWDYVGTPDFLGFLCVNSGELPECAGEDGAAPATWYPLGPRPGDKGRDELDRGQIQLAMKLVYDPAFDPTEDRPFFDEPLSDEQRDLAAHRTPNELRVAVCRARGVRAMDPAPLFSSKAATSDPYCVVKVQGRPERKTRVHMETLDPVWNEVYTFDLHVEDFRPAAAKPGSRLSLHGREPKRLDAAQLELVVWDWDRLDTDDFLGRAVVALEPLARTQRPEKAWLNLADEGASEAPAEPEIGELLVYVQWRYNPASDYCPFEESDDVYDRPANELRVALHRGRDLCIRDPNLFSQGGTSDPMMVFKIMQYGKVVQTFKTGIRHKTLDPVWRETHAVELRPPGTDDDAEDWTLRCVCEDVDFGKSNDFMGMFDIVRARRAPVFASRGRVAADPRRQPRAPPRHRGRSARQPRRHRGRSAPPLASPRHSSPDVKNPRRRRSRRSCPRGRTSPRAGTACWKTRTSRTRRRTLAARFACTCSGATTRRSTSTRGWSSNRT